MAVAIMRQPAPFARTVQTMIDSQIEKVHEITEMLYHSMDLLKRITQVVAPCPHLIGSGTAVRQC